MFSRSARSLASMARTRGAMTRSVSVSKSINKSNDSKQKADH
jgi:hypothetical protein